MKKYPRTVHLPWSLGSESDDKMLQNVDHFVGKQFVATIKMDGENCTAHANGHIHARSLDSVSGPDRDWVKKFLLENVCYNLPEGWRVCGENLFAKHSIFYENLKSYFMGFSIWNDKNICLSWEDTLAWFELLNVTPVEVVYEGIFDVDALKKLEKTMDFSKQEGYVIRLKDSFHYDDFGTSVAKFVRANHVQTDQHWRHSTIVPNVLKDENEKETCNS